MDLLLSHGAQTDARDVDGEAPLHKAAAGDNPECVTLLLQHDAHVDAVDFEGNPTKPSCDGMDWTGLGALTCGGGRQNSADESHSIAAAGIGARAPGICT